jgi:hypothetical protein
MENEETKPKEPTNLIRFKRKPITEQSQVVHLNYPQNAQANSVGKTIKRRIAELYTVFDENHTGKNSKKMEVGEELLKLWEYKRAKKGYTYKCTDYYEWLLKKYPLLFHRDPHGKAEVTNLSVRYSTIYFLVDGVSMRQKLREGGIAENKLLTLESHAMPFRRAKLLRRLKGKG